MKCRLPWFLIFVLCGSVAHACLWFDATTLEGKLVSRGIADGPTGAPPLGEQELRPRVRSHLRTKADILHSIAIMRPEDVLDLSNETSDFPADWPPELNDAVKPIFTGEFQKSADMLAELNLKYPNNYYVCANLGVTSELTGKDAEALQWVEKAMKIKPDAHNGTEWMHSAVLRAKLALAKEPAWLETHTISGIPLGDVPKDFSLQEGGRHIELKDIQAALFAHAVPRLLLVKGVDRIVAAMLTELARVEARLVSVEAGIAMLKLAADHGAANTEPLLKDWETRVADRKRWSWLRLDGGHNPEQLLLLTGSAILGWTAYYIRSRRRTRKAITLATLPN